MANMPLTVLFERHKQLISVKNSKRKKKTIQNTI